MLQPQQQQQQPLQPQIAQDDLARPGQFQPYSNPYAQPMPYGALPQVNNPNPPVNLLGQPANPYPGSPNPFGPPQQPIHGPFNLLPQIINPHVGTNPFGPSPSLQPYRPPQQPSHPLVNTNVLSINLGELGKEKSIATGDCVFCQSCKAIFNSTSKITLSKGAQREWECEFCQQINEVHLDEEEIPTQDTYDYVLEAAPSANLNASQDNTCIIFVLDMSGSMCSTTEVTGKHNFKGYKPSTGDFGQDRRADQYLPNERRDITYVSRLQCVQAAVANQIEALFKNHPNSKVGLVCFNNEVTVIGDGTSQPAIITGDKLEAFDALLEEGLKHRINSSIKDSKDALIKKLYAIEETGATALGPAFMVALGMVKNSPGSKIVLATDGLANCGVGALDIDPASPFYATAGNLAKTHGITASIIGIRGDNLNINLIGKLSDITQGDTDIVDPLKIKDTFSDIVDSKVVATNVVVRLFLHKVFKFPEDDNWKPENQKEGFSLHAVRDIGTSFEDTEVTAEFYTRDEEELLKILGSKYEMEMNNDSKHMPFQVQISYTTLTGMKCMRVITKTKEITRDAVEAQEDIDVAVFGMHANAKQANLASLGMLDEAVQHSEQVNQIMLNNVRNDEERNGYGNYLSGQNEFISRVKGVQAAQQMQSPMVSNVYEMRQQQQQLLEQDDDNSNVVYANRNVRKQKKNWGSSRKY